MDISTDEKCEICGKTPVLGVHGLNEHGEVQSRYFCEEHANSFRKGKIK